MTSDLQRRPLGNAGPPVTVLGFGAMELRGTAHRNPRPLPEATVEEVLRTVLDEGINFIDTSIDYGQSEEWIGRFIGNRRDEYVLASKVGCPLEHQPDAPRGGPLVHDFSPANIRAGVEQSLRRLRTDYLDLAQVHNPPSADDLRTAQVVETLTELREAGLIRAFGISSMLPHIDGHIAIDEFETFQVPYSGLERDLERRIDAIGQSGRGVIVRGGVAQGGGRVKTTSTGQPIDWEASGLESLGDGESAPGFLLRFALTNPSVSTVIVGTADPDHIRTNVQAARRGPLAADVYAEAQRLLDGAGATPS